LDRVAQRVLNRLRRPPCSRHEQVIGTDANRTNIMRSVYYFDTVLAGIDTC
jgi:hypothetical protein